MIPKPVTHIKVSTRNFVTDYETVGGPEEGASALRDVLMGRRVWCWETLPLLSTESKQDTSSSW